MLDILLKHPNPRYDSLQQEIDQLLRENDRLTIANSNLKQENVYLRRRVHQRDTQLRLIRAAHADALILVSWYITGLSISKRDCLAAGMPVRRWARARALLEMARLLDGRQLKTTNTVAIQSALNGALARAQQDPLLFRLRQKKY